MPGADFAPSGVVALATACFPEEHYGVSLSSVDELCGKDLARRDIDSAFAY